MTHLMKTTATAAIVALMSAAPLAASPESGSPQQSVVNDPDESVAKKKVTTESVIESTDAGTPAQAVDVDGDEAVAANDSDNKGTIADELPTNSPVLNDS